ncbi:MAG: DUF4852 domain-containing protein [Mucilaginibacter sp.]|uniref:DUF4852 domain-containing protein n=1 Tax=Mucilaginibacter sp. TaxID=1882438 RepID=UPI003266BEA7
MAYPSMNSSSIKKTRVVFFGLFLITLIFNNQQARAQILRAKSPTSINGLTYDVFLKILPNWGNSVDSLLLAVDFRLLCVDRNGNYDSYEKTGGVFSYNKMYFGRINNNVNANRFYSTSCTSPNRANGFLNNYFKCYPVFNPSSNTYYVLLFNGNDNENIKIQFRTANTPYFVSQPLEIYPQIGLDTTSVATWLTSIRKTQPEDKVQYYKKEYKMQTNFIPIVSGDINSEAFPHGNGIAQFLSSNSEFKLKQNMDLYKEILRFRSVYYQYDERKLKSVLQDFDENYPQYSNNEFVLKEKINDLVKLLRACKEKINLGEIFYKDIDIEIGQYDFNNNRYNLFRMEYGDNYYGAKRLNSGGFMLSSKGVEFFFNNWLPFSQLQINPDQAKLFLDKIGTQRRIKERIYFLIQPNVAINENEDFEGVFAYALKAEILKDCISQPAATIENTIISNITSQDVKRCYTNAINELNGVLARTQSDNVPYVDKLKPGYEILANYNVPYPDHCEKAYFLLAGKLEKTAPGQDILKFAVITNYYYLMQDGYTIEFKNSLTNQSYPLVITKILKYMNGPLEFEVKATRQTVDAMVKSQINEINIQAAGPPKYNVGTTSTWNSDWSINSFKPQTIGAHFNSPNNLNSFFSKGL